MKALTANRLLDGEAVWYADGAWVEAIDSAELAADKEGEQRLEAAGRAAHAANLVVDVNLIEVEQVEGVVQPTRLRERIRAAGPTIRTDLGKQARMTRAA